MAIYIKEMNKRGGSSEGEQHKHKHDSIKLVQGLLKAMQVAHADRNMILFERIKSVIAIMAKGST